MQQLFNKEFYVEEQNNNIKSTAFYILANITDYCNRNCSYCNLHNNLKTLNLDLLYYYLMSFLKADYRSIVLDIFGGEPTLHEKYFSFIKSIKDNNRIKVRTFSNFTNLTSFYNNCLKYSNFFLTCHNDNNFYKKLLDIDTEFYNKLYLIVMYEKENGSVEKSVTIYKKLLQTFSSIKIELRLVEGVENYYTEEELKLYFNLVSKTKQISNEYILNDKDVSYYDLINHQNIKHAICNTGEDSVYIDCDGKIKYCLQSKQVLGNLYSNANFVKYKKHVCLLSKDCTCNFDTYRTGIVL